MRQSILPDDLMASTIEDLLPWEMAYTVPWAITADIDGLMWINKNYPFLSVPSESFVTKIKNMGDYIIVYKETIGWYRYSRGEKAVHLEISADSYLPVVLENE